ncbi:hypothetical protein MTX78_10535 [Hymenobacter tibetensis]|uniref:Uncharacterized protein n=1 Tax=Hymenobacter tibetensis TaxID=497967 RepID=A0ABY4DA89_9BACT|nr:hypothetical protein [Hymenobacter tibetensis]UOG77018.1 hypothetical protein MTX78_10535 [Hymenobacter tibetensis]
MTDSTPPLPNDENDGPPPASPEEEHPVDASVAPPTDTPVAAPLPLPQQFAEMRSEDSRVILTNDQLQVNGQRFGWWELEGVEVQRVRWLLWLLLGGFTLAGFLLGFLQNWLRTMPAALGIVVGALLLAVGQRGTNRLRLYRLGREAAHFALPGELPTWQKLTAEANRRIRQRHHEAAQAAAAALLAATPPMPSPPSAFEAG